MDFATYEAITRLRYQYAVGIDTRDWQLHRSIYVDEIEMDFTSYSGGDGPTRMPADAWVAGLKPLFEGLSATQHVMTNPLIELDGQTATQRMYMKAEHFLIEDGEKGPGLRPGAQAGPHAGRIGHDHRARRCAPHADDHEGTDLGRARDLL